ncbi:putative ribonucleotide-diphosphate reductase alpha subunit [Candidatus Carsonella ruddii PC isolate NHV]|uniref:Putative ribonucleotide-diphosphate reductase alpha subunit n=1 Tax=Candidatus Carsonella ruddii PC isolate NHV TaxID=1202540 RepID=J3VQJ8_CARRU|nr:putative ribonucleotide-diphosphate reductase alpha subunit [Candidatus Carsonella ruddii PC isolate NHV]
MKIYSFCNYKTNILKVLNKIKKNEKIFNFINYYLNYLNYKNKKKIGLLLYFKVSKKISILNIKKNGIFFFSNKNIYLYKILKNYDFNDIFDIIKIIKINKIQFNIKIVKKIFTKILKKKNKQIYENLEERFLITIFLNNINETNKKMFVYKSLLNYNINNFFIINKDFKKVCSIMYLNKNENFTKKIHLGLIKNNYNNKIPFYLNYIFNYFLKFNELKLNLSIEIYNLDVLKIIKMIKKIKKIKIFINIGINDLFFEKFFKNKKLILFNSIEIKKNYGYYLQNFYDEYIGFGSFRKLYYKIFKNKNIFKVKINAKNFFLKIFKTKNLKIFFLDTLNRNNINKHISSLFSNFFHPKIFDKNNFFKKNYFFYKNNNVLINKNNSFYLELFFFINFKICKNFKKKITFLYKILNKKNENFIIEKELYFCLNYRIKPITIYFNEIKKKIKEYIYFLILKVNCYLSKLSEPYCWYLGSDIYNYNFFYKKMYISNKWNLLLDKINLFKLKNSFYLNFTNKKLKVKLKLLNNYILKLIIKNWQKKNEKY